MLGILEDLLDVLRVPFLHELEDLCGLVPVQLLYDIGRMLGRHLVKDARDLRLVEGADESQQRGVVQPREHLAGALRGEPTEERDLLVEGQALEGRSYVRRVGRLERLIVAGVLAALEQALGRVEQPLLIAHDHRVRRVPSLAAADWRPTASCERSRPTANRGPG